MIGFPVLRIIGSLIFIFLVHVFVIRIKKYRNTVDYAMQAAKKAGNRAIYRFLNDMKRYLNSLAPAYIVNFNWKQTTIRTKLEWNLFNEIRIKLFKFLPVDGFFNINGFNSLISQSIHRMFATCDYFLLNQNCFQF